MNDKAVSERVDSVALSSINPRVSRSEAEYVFGKDEEEVITITIEKFNGSTDPLIKSRLFSLVTWTSNPTNITHFIKQLLNTESFEWKVAVCESFVEGKTICSIGDIVHLALNDADADVRFTAVESLGKVGTPSEIKVLEQIRIHDDGEDYGGFPISGQAEESISEIKARYHLQ